jgi:hypothetical protein
MLRPEYLSKKLDQPLPTKDGGTLRTIGEARDYMAAKLDLTALSERQRKPRACRGF